MKKSNIITLIIFVVLLGLFLVNNFFRDQWTTEKEQVDFNVDTTIVNYLAYNNDAGEKIILQKVEGEWQLTNPIQYKANKQLVHMLLKEVQDMEIITPSVSENSENYDIFGVDSADGNLFTIKSGEKTIVQFYAGKNGPGGYGTNYIRANDNNNVYIVSANFVPIVRRDAELWRDKTIFALDKNTISGLETIASGNHLKYSLTDSGWIVQSVKTDDAIIPDPTKTERLLAAASDFKANAFPDSQAIANFKFDDEPDFIIRIIADHTYELQGYSLDEKGNKYYAIKKGDENNVFIIYRSTAERLLKTFDDLSEPVQEPTLQRPPTPPTQQDILKNLTPEQREQIMKQLQQSQQGQ